MLDHLGKKEASVKIVRSIEKVLSKKNLKTNNLNHGSNTFQCAKAVLENL